MSKEYFKGLIKTALTPMRQKPGTPAPIAAASEAMVGAGGRMARLDERANIDKTKNFVLKHLKVMGSNMRDAGTELVGGDTDMAALNRMQPPKAQKTPKAPAKKSKKKEGSMEKSQFYAQGLIDKCAELGVDPEALVKSAVVGPRGANATQTMLNLYKSFRGARKPYSNAPTKISDWLRNSDSAEWLSLPTQRDMLTGDNALGRAGTNALAETGLTGVPHNAITELGKTRGSEGASALAKKLVDIRRGLRVAGTSPRKLMQEANEFDLPGLMPSQQEYIARRMYGNV
jgi:hypothetical protein